jgi:two-component sensor histidine kinase
MNEKLYHLFKTTQPKVTLKGLPLYATLIILSLFTFTSNGQQPNGDEKVFERIENLMSNRDKNAVDICIDSVMINDLGFYHDNLSRFLLYKGKCQIVENDYTEAFKLFFDALKVSESKNNERETANIKMELGLVFLHFDESQLATKMFEEAEALFAVQHESHLFARCGYLRAVSHKRLGSYELSNDILEKVKATYLENQDSLGLAEVNNAIGLNYKNLRQVEKAVTHFEEAIELFAKLDENLKLAKTYNNLANVYQIDGRWNLALKNHEKSIKIKETIKDTLGIAASYINLSVIYKRTGALEKALNYGNRSLSLLNLAGKSDNRRLSQVYSLMSELHEQIGNQAMALKFARMEHDATAALRVENEAMLIRLFEKKQDVKFYTISDSLLQSKEILQDKFDAAQNENAALTKEKSYFLTLGLISVAILLLVFVIVIYSRLLSEKKVKAELQVTNEALKVTRISKEEKEVLLQEIHHRVKNNMQIISSLIRLQSNQSEEKEIRDIFTVTQHRINSMALVHEQLYKAKNFEKLELSGYLTELVNHLVDSYQSTASIERKISIEESRIDIDTIIPIGLIVNEVISNSLKHAFLEQETGCISVNFYQVDEKNYVLELEDNGNGCAEQADLDSESLGTELINSLVQQIDGTLKLDRSQGYHYTINIPKL